MRCNACWTACCAVSPCARKAPTAPRDLEVTYQQRRHMLDLCGAMMILACCMSNVSTASTSNCSRAVSCMAARGLYRCILQTLRRSQQQGLPVTGVLHLPAVTSVLDPWTAAATRFRTAQGSLADGFVAIRSLAQQQGFLLAAEEDTLEALRMWAQLQDRCAAVPVQDWTQATAMDAAVQGAMLLQRLYVQQTMAQLLLEEEVEEQRLGLEASLQQAAHTLDDIAAKVQQQAPGAAGGPCTHAQLEALSTVLFKQLRFRYEPVEWVYDGLAPVLLPEVLQRRKGIPLSLCLVVVAVGARLGMPLQLVCAQDALLPGVASGLPHLQDLPPDVAARQAARSVAAPPAPNTWLVAAQVQQDNSSSSSSSQQQQVGPAAGAASWWLLDPTQKGALVDAATAMHRYPGLQQELQQAPVSAPGDASSRARPTTSIGIGSSSSNSRKQQQHFLLHKLQHLPSSGVSSAGAWQHVHAAQQLQASVVRTWAELARVMVMAHQRRGESDLVAHWLYQLLALDTQAAEWQQLSAAEGPL